MIARLIEALRHLEPPPTAEELAEALWLARMLPAGPAGAAERPGDPGGPTDRTPVPPDAPPDAGDPGPTPPARTGAGSAHRPRAGLMIAEPHAPDAELIRAPAMPAIPRALHIARALRPLRVGQPSRTVRLLDERATAQRIAETGIWEPVTRPVTERRLDLALVVDDSASMVVWRRTVDELQVLLERLAAFRDVRMWRFDGDADRLTLRPGGAAGRGTERSPRELIDPTHRRVVLVISDCIGRAWQDGRVAGLLARWGRCGPVAIVQPLPYRLWERCGAAFHPVRLRAARRGLPNSDLDVRCRDGDESPPGIAVPVMELDADWLRPWAELVGTGGECRGMALFTGRPTAELPPEPGGDARTPLERVLEFRGAASPLAYRLAGYLAAAPLQLPVMRLVQQAMLPESRPSHLAEVFLGDLLRKAGPADDPDEVVYEFHDGVRDVLLSGLHRGEALRVLREVWEVIRGRWGSAPDFPALLRALHRGADGVPLDGAFAQVATTVLARLGGRYAEIAQRLATTVPDLSPVPDPFDDDEPGDVVAVREVGRSARISGGGLPARNPNFTGRDEQLRALREMLGEAVTALLPRTPHDLGGVGKSQLAVEYAHRYAADYDLVWWIPAEQITLARSSLADLARRLGMPLSDDINRTVRHLLQELRRGRPRERWLLIYDNATDPDDLVPLLPAELAQGRLTTSLPSGHVLLTSRDQRWADRTLVSPVGVFQRPESVALLRRRVPRLPPQDADRVAARLGDLPLAVEQAAAWHAETGRTAREYLELLDRRLAREPIRTLPVEYPPELAATLGMAFDRLREEAPAAGQLLELWAFFGPEPVTADLLAAGARARLPAPLKAILQDPDGLTRAMRDIDRLTLGRYDRTAGSLQVHRLVRTMLQTRLTGRSAERVRDRVHRILAAATPQAPPNDESTWPRREQIAPHVVPAGIIDGSTAQIRQVALDQMRYLYLLGDFEGCRVLGELAQERWLRTLGPYDESTLLAGRELGNVLRALGQVAEAAELNRQMFRRAHERYGPDHISTMLIANSVGADLRLRGDFRAALELDRDTMRRMVRMFGRDHAQTLMVVNNVGIDLRLLGLFQQAREIDEGALGQLRRRLGDRHRSTLLTMNQLARDLHGLGLYRQAAGLQRTALETMRETLGPDHAYVLHAETSHVGTLRRLGDRHGARELAEETLRLHLRRFGPDHPDTLAAQRSLAVACAVTGDAEKGRRLCEAAHHRYRRLLGFDHPFVHACATNLAITLRALGRHEEAQREDDTALRALNRTLGSDHYYTLCCSVGLVHDLYRTGRREAAYERSRETLGRFRDRYGPRHPYTLASAHNHAVIGAALGRNADPAEALPALRAALGADHPDAADAAEGRLLECDIEPIPL
ncbi:FxSxx-COOH system tetratricopeptide repeat protein [Thermomonospora cellulosilytica]|uniref:Tetratricopeptide (TPR) repeat protein n=1 Tax=Thermomonospora cellulosilytica TaxID=1411118 RepID=A0A7W3MYS2_9ACTN|nr:FxSxx-COOH system tetratricopeptide repeat protein [Thermomonospora cellulosilytica]MBA9004377.1 tetratricopeptide (TPR) repeat protein [Thermomonospora cellulosilytica]